MAIDVRIPSGAKLQPFFTPVEVFEIGSPGMAGQLIIHNGKLYVYSDVGVTLIDGGIIQTEALLANSITAAKLKVGGRSWSHNIVWTATDVDTCSWSEGTIKFADGTTDDIDAGDTGDIAAQTYIYYDGTATLKTTTDYSVAVGDSKVLLAIVEEGDTGGKCIITPIRSVGTTIDGDKIVTGKIESVDGKTYFDLNGKLIMVNDGSNDRILIGFQSGGFS